MPILRLQAPGLSAASADQFERTAGAVAGVKRVDTWQDRAEIDLTDGARTEPVLIALRAAGFKVRETAKTAAAACDVRPTKRTRLLELLGLFGLVLLGGALFERLGFGSSAYTPTGSFIGAMFIGLVAGSSSCLAVSGGLLLSSAGKYRERYGSAGWVRLNPALLFIIGRVLAYGLFGGLISLIGWALTPSPFATGLITVAAAIYMLVMGLEMLQLAPRWLSRVTPRLPKSWSRLVLDAEGREHPAMPLLLGAGTFFLPCGFTQTLQVYALTTGSFLAGASVLAGFALGTAPALLALGWASTSLQGRAGAFFFKLSGALVVVLGLWNVQNGLTAAGYPLPLERIGTKLSAAASDRAETADPNVVFDGQTQVIRMKLASGPFYLPSDHYTVRAGVPVRLEIEGVGTGCRTIFQIPKFGVQVALNQPLNVIEFTPDKPGDAVFSCSMGMFRGNLKVVAARS